MLDSPPRTRALYRSGPTLLLGAALAWAGPTSPAAADERFWNAPDGGAFDDPSNWDDGLTPVPGPDDTAIFDLAAAYDVTLDGVATNDRLLVRRGVITFTALPAFGYELLLATGPASPAIVIGDLLGDAADLTLDRGTLSGDHAIIGQSAGSVGWLTLDGPLSGLNLAGELAVGGSGVGFLEVERALVLGERGSVGRNAGAVGAVTVGGIVAQWDLEGQLTVGNHGTGTLLVERGGNVTCDDAIIALGENAMGDVVVRDEPSVLDVTGSLDVGMSGFGSLLVENGGRVGVGDFAIISTFPAPFGVPGDGGVGSVQVRDAASFLSVAGDLFVGFFNDGRIELSQGGRVLVGGDLVINRRDDLSPDPVVIALASAGTYAGDPAFEVTGIVDSDDGGAAVRLAFEAGYAAGDGDTFALIGAAGGLGDVEVLPPSLVDPLDWVVTTDGGVLRATVAACSADDCNGNGVGDDCDIAFGLSGDCNDNGIPDECDITDGTSPDCDRNGVPDECDIESGAADDCNDNDVPDICEVLSFLFIESGPLGPIGEDSPQVFAIADPPVTLTDVTLTFDAVADLGSDFETIDIEIDGTPVGTVFEFGGKDCTPMRDVLVVDGTLFNDAAADGLVEIAMLPDITVSTFFCGSDNTIAVTVEFAEQGDNDENGNGIPDDCECALADLDDDGAIGFGDALLLLSDWGPCPGCPTDLDGDDVVGFTDLLIILTAWGPCP